MQVKFPEATMADFQGHAGQLAFDDRAVIEQVVEAF